MTGQIGAKKRANKGQSNGGVGMDFVGLFPASDSDDEKTRQGPTAATASAKKGGAAQQDWSLFPDKEEALVQPAAASATGGRRGENKAASGVTGRASGSTPASEKVTGGNGELNPGWDKKKKKKKKRAKNTTVVKEEEEGEAIPSPLHAGVDGDEESDLEAARGTRPPSTSGSVEERAIDEFELNKDRSPAEWMRVRDTTGTAFLWYTVILQIASACCSLVFLASRGESQLSWKTGCWGRWTSLADAEEIEFVEFDTHIGWQMYGKGDRLGLLSEVSQRAAVIGGLAGGMHTLVIFVGFTFFFFSLSALWLSHHSACCPRRRSSEEEEEDGPAKLSKHENPLGLGRDCHRWMFAMAGIDILAGLWCFGIGCAGFYFVVTREFTDGLEEMVSAWGEDVSCARAQTSPRYGFFVNAVSVLLLLGGGIVTLYKTYTCDRDLSEAVEMWENDRAETTEMESRLAMIKKKENYAAAVASAAASAAQTPVTIFKSKKTTAAAASDNEASAAAAAAAAGDGNSVLPLSPPLPPSPKTVGSSTTTTGGPKERHKRTVTTVALSSIDLGSEEGKIDSAVRRASGPSRPSLLGSSCRPIPELESVDWDVESVVGSAAMLDSASKSTFSDDLPPPQGWEVRTTPSGDKFWVNILTKNVSWEKPTE